MVKKVNKERDYKRFVKHIEEWDKNNVAYSKKDMYELSRKYNVTPCDEECQFFRFGECLTMERPLNGQLWVCDKPEKYER